MITFIFPYVPVPKQSARFAINRGGKIMSFTKSEVKSFEKRVALDAWSQKPRGFKIMSGPIAATVVYEYKYLKSHKRDVTARIVLGEKIYKTSTPDLTDNISKGIFDALKKHIFEDDAMIAKFTAEKYWSVRDRITLTLTQL